MWKMRRIVTSSFRLQSLPLERGNVYLITLNKNIEVGKRRVLLTKSLHWVRFFFCEPSYHEHIKWVLDACHFHYKFNTMCCLKLPLLPQPEDLPSRPSLFFSLAHDKDSNESRLISECSTIHLFKSLFHLSFMHYSLQLIFWEKSRK